MTNQPVPASTDSGTVACAASRGADELAKPPTPWGVESPEVAPSVPGSDATPTPSEVQRVIKQVAANVVATLPAFFDDRKADLEGLDPGLLASTPPYAYDALSLPMTDAAFDFITYGFGVRSLCVGCFRIGCWDEFWSVGCLAGTLVYLGQALAGRLASPHQGILFP